MRHARIAGLLAFAALAFAAPAAHAASETTNCAGLQAALTQAVAGDTITLDQLCTTTNSGAADGAFTLPNDYAFTLTGQAGSGAGFDGTGVDGPVLQGTVGGDTAGASFTLSSLTVENDNGRGEGAIDIEAGGEGGITVQSMTFENDDGTGSYGFGGALSIYDEFCAATGTTTPFTLSGSTFTGNAEASTGYAYGGAAAIAPGCYEPVSRAVVVTNNVFSGNSASSSNTSDDEIVGGGLVVYNDALVIAPLTQSGNVFTGDSVLGASGATTDDFGGGGEWIEGMDLTSTDDAFINNTATGATGSSSDYWTWGAGLGIVNSSCSDTSHTVGVATNLDVAGNTVTGGTAADINGAGIYTGCGIGTGSDLTLQDSTVSGNSSAAGSVAGIGGETIDHLILTNSIDTGNTGGSDLGGFNGSGGSITASYSDACAGGAALPGTGNLCAAPALASATDVHETAASPTIDKGSNALVPAGLSTDIFGSSRILPGTLLCSGTVPAIVDIGAAEYVPAAPTCPKPTPIPPPAPAPQVTTAHVGNQQITLVTPALSACTASTGKLAATLSSATGTKGTKLKFSSAAFYIDKGIKHTTHKTKHLKDGKTKHIKITVYEPNATAHHVPTTVELSLTGLKAGTHTLKVILSYKETKKEKHGKHKTVTVTKTVKTPFTVC